MPEFQSVLMNKIEIDLGKCGGKPLATMKETLDEGNTFKCD